MNKQELNKWENWDKLNIETAKLILEQAEKNLTETISAADSLTNRALNIMQACFVLLFGLIGYVFIHDSADISKHLSVIAIFFLFPILYLTYRVYNLYHLKPLGNLPSKMITDEKTNHDNQTLVYIFNCIKTTEKSIVFNEEKNTKRVNDLRIVFYLIWAGVCFELIYSLAFQFLASHL